MIEMLSVGIHRVHGLLAAVGCSDCAVALLPCIASAAAMISESSQLERDLAS
jgi:hypothetical protein